jgi:5'-nucleotidase
MRIVLTNDDGVAAPGLTALAAAVARLGATAVIVAPAEPHSGCGHRVTTDRPLRVESLGAGRYAVAGTPADCVRLALAELVPDAAVVYSGINAGGNLGVDILHSGTVAAAREAALHGRPAVAASQYHRRGTTIDWDRAARWLAAVLGRVRLDDARPGEFWNVNLPDPAAGELPAIVECPADVSPLEIGYAATADGHFEYRGNYHARPRVSGGDVDVCFGGAIAVSRLRVV